MASIDLGARTDVLRHKVGCCPACRDYLWAEVTVVARVSEPSISVDGKTHVYASAEPVAMTIAHACDNRDEDSARCGFDLGEGDCCALDPGHGGQHS